MRSNLTGSLLSIVEMALANSSTGGKPANATRHVNEIVLSWQMKFRHVGPDIGKWLCPI